METETKINNIDDDFYKASTPKENIKINVKPAIPPRHIIN